MERKEKILVIIALLIMLSLGIAFGTIINEKKAIEYKEIAVQTCQYSITLTNLSNNQANLLELCNPTEYYQRLNYLNCSLIK
jgi:uncharacterized protein YebE (UPF0316 family)